MDNRERALEKLMKSRHWVQAEKMIAALDKSSRPLSSDDLRRNSGCEKRKLHSIVYVVRRYYERVEGTTLNRTDLGYHVGVNVGDHIDQATDHFAATIARMKRHGESMAIIGTPDTSKMSEDDRAAWTMNRAASLMFDAVIRLADESKPVLMHSPKNQKRLEDAGAKSRHPFDPLDALKAARSDVTGIVGNRDDDGDDEQ